MVVEVLFYCRSTGRIELRYLVSHDLVEFNFFLLLVCAVLFYPAVFEMCGLRTDTHSGCLVGTTSLRIVGSIFLVKNTTRSFTAPKHELMVVLHCFPNFVEILPIHGSFR